MFKKLVPTGQGTLSIKRDQDDDADDDQAHKLENATGVSCSVSFTGRNAEMKDMGQVGMVPVHSMIILCPISLNYRLTK